MERIARILGKSARASIVFSAQKRLQFAEVTIQARLQTIAAAGKADTLESALRQALEHAENQARRHRDRRMTSKRLPNGRKGAHRASGGPAQSPRRPAGGRTARRRSLYAPARKPRAVIAVHSFPARKTVVEPHILTSGEAIALKAMTIEEAVKEAEFRDRDLLVFRNLSGELFVLHRRRDGQMELVEIP